MSRLKWKTKYSYPENYFLNMDLAGEVIKKQIRLVQVLADMHIYVFLARSTI